MKLTSTSLHVPVQSLISGQTQSVGNVLSPSPSATFSADTFRLNHAMRTDLKSVRFSGPALTQKMLDTESLKALLTSMEKKLEDKLIVLSGAELSEDVNLDIATMTVKAPEKEGVDRIYIVTRNPYFLNGDKTKPPLKDLDGNTVYEYDFVQYKNGKPDSKSKIRSIRISRLDKDFDQMTYQEYSTGKISAPKPKVSDDFILTQQFRIFIKKLEDAGLFSAQAKLDEASRSNDLEF